MTELGGRALLPLPGPLQRHIDDVARKLLHPPDGPAYDFTEPHGEAALVPPDSVSWRIFKNPVTLFIGGVGAVILELAEPAVRTGVWEHSSFRLDPVERLQRTGLAAMVTVYAARTTAEAMIAHVVSLHKKVTGRTPSGEPYHANDVRLLTWVHATASYGFVDAYHRYANRLSGTEFDRLYAEGRAGAKLYGALDAPRSQAELESLFDRMRNRLEPSPIIFEFLKIMHDAPALPRPLWWLQRMLVRAGVDLTPDWVRQRLGLTADYGLRHWERPLVALAGATADRMMLRSSPAVQSCRRLSLPEDYLYRR